MMLLTSSHFETGSALASTADDGDGSNGVIVKVTTGDFNQDPIKYRSRLSW